MDCCTRAAAAMLIMEPQGCRELAANKMPKVYMQHLAVVMGKLADVQRYAAGWDKALKVLEPQVADGAEDRIGGGWRGGSWFELLLQGLRLGLGSWDW